MNKLQTLVAEELARPVDPQVTAMAAALAADYPEAARAVLFYGSCLRQRELDGLMLDFYLIVSDYRDAYGSAWLTLANRMVPPNVFPFEHEGLIAKYAVLSEADFAREADRLASTVSVWARFAQPSRLVWASDGDARSRVVETVARAAPTLLNAAAAVAAETQSSITSLDLWRLGFRLTYDAELRAERTDRSTSIVDLDADRYLLFTEPALEHTPLALCERRGVVDLTGLDWRDLAWERQLWPKRRWKGKALTLLRLAKATTTFAGGVDYLAWKINRHAGAGIEVKPWMRRWPILGALTLLPRLWRGGAIR
ncbi:hypothetical protein RCO27_18065 [Sphingosinicella sp. LHD-64]|uniref:hypothetical protein n=1 Tax=Sphingosinicella sp. LHD-64 TaxID=3072139 RepID=UPI00280D9229|nr:hypothetical protein [Sphingosinicella sp. LHD-64]MDQ8758136.1 hypothetical protein [Sphingosinicella sp. LHD-64]